MNTGINLTGYKAHRMCCLPKRASSHAWPPTIGSIQAEGDGESPPSREKKGLKNRSVSDTLCYPRMYVWESMTTLQESIHHTMYGNNQSCKLK